MNGKINGLKDYIHNFDGYKISDTHFRIGAKLHTENFFYAKRLFQNSYYTSRIAMLLAIKINKYLNNGFFDKQNNITIIGYEMYSELLLSLIEKFLHESGYPNVNHIIVLDDDGQIKHLPDITINDNFVIIVPIASTGSTAKKIETYIKVKKNGKARPILPPFNVLQVFDPNYPEYRYPNQECLIELKTEWHIPSTCQKCFNDVESMVLFETDKSSLTPALIFDLPTVKEIDNDFSVKIDKIENFNSLIYRKIKRNNEQSLFYIDTNNFIKDNFEIIDKWLSSIKTALDVKPTDSIVIISPCHESNTEFINLVNDKVFNSSAAIIHYQIGNDYLENFKLLNQKYFEYHDIRIFFVDDSLKTGQHFFNIYDLYRYTTHYDQGKNLNGAIFLSNKSTPDIYKRVKRAAKNIYSFVNLNLPFSQKIFGVNPLAHEVKKYRNIANIALNDVIKTTFKNKANDIDGVEENVKSHEKEREERHIIMLKATHKIYEYFATKPNLKKETLDSVLRHCGFNKNRENKIAMMKVLSQYPFLLYLPIRKEVFNWHKDWFNQIIDIIGNKLSQVTVNDPFTYSDFQDFKFLIRRAVFLGNYRILSSDVFKLIALMFETINKPGINISIFQHISIENSQEKSSIKKNLSDFHLFLLYQYVEIIYKNSWCASHISEEIKKNEPKFITTLQGKQFIRMLRIEIAVVLNDFYDMLHKDKKWISLYKTAEYIDTNVDNIIHFLDENKDYLKSNKFEVCENVLKIRSSDDFKPQFINYLWIKQFLNTDINNKKIKLPPYQNKIDEVFGKLKRLFENNNIGAFFIVTDKQENPHLLYDKNEYGGHLLQEYDTISHDIVHSFLKGEPDSQNIDKKTIIEYINQGHNKWDDIYGIVDSTKNKEFYNEYRHLLMIRISSDKSETLGLMGFYSRENPYDDWLAKQFLMLLRRDIGEFIIKHHKNDEFRTWIENEKIRKVYESKFDKFHHSGKRFIETFQNLVNNNAERQILVTMSDVIHTQIIFGTYYAAYLERITKNERWTIELKEENDNKYSDENLKDIKTVIENLNEVYSEKYPEEVNCKIILDDFERIRTLLPFRYLKKIIIELICNSLSKLESRIKITFDNTRLTAVSFGRKLPDNILKLEQHIKSDFPSECNFGIGLFMIEKIIYNNFNRHIEIESTPEEEFRVIIPLNKL